MADFVLAHSEILKCACRICGEFFKKEQKHFPLKTQSIKRNLVNYFNIDVDEDKKGQHPPHICNKCYMVLKNIDSKGVTSRCHLFNWPEACVGPCMVCIRYNNRTKGGRPKKGKKGFGRPSSKKVWTRHLTAALIKESKDLNIVSTAAIEIANKSIIDLCKCLICKRLFKKPVMLDCQHSFCLTCLVSKFEGEKDVICPTCSSVTTPELIKVSKSKEELLDNLIYECCCGNVKLNEKDAHICPGPTITAEMVKTARTVIKSKLETSENDTIEIESGGPNVSFY